MGKIVIFCAGVSSVNSAPRKQVEALLINVPNAGKSLKSILKTKELIQNLNPKYVKLDSGGYPVLNYEDNLRKKLGYTGIASPPGLIDQLLDCDPNAPLSISGKFNLMPWHVVTTAFELQITTMLALDLPVRRLKKLADQEFEFLQKLPINVKWAIDTWVYHRKLDLTTPLLLPVQCYNIRQFDSFYDFIKYLSFAGFALPVRFMKYYQIAPFLVRFYEVGCREHVHLLGTYSFFTIALAAYFARHYFEVVSLDAQSWWINASQHNYLKPSDLTPQLAIDGHYPHGFLENCDCCPWCRYQDLSTIAMMENPELCDFYARHNFWVTERCAEDLYNAADDPHAYRTFLLGRTHKEADVNRLCDILENADMQLRGRR